MTRSQPHRAVLALLRAATGVTPGPDDVEDVRRAPPERVMAIARAHNTLPALAPPKTSPLAAVLEPDALIFLEEMYMANMRRNAKLTGTLEEIARRLTEERIEAAVLKGGAELIRPFGGSADRRFVGDLDLLVAPEQIMAARRILLAAGWQEAEVPAIERTRHHHLPPLFRPGTPGMVELHRRLGNDHIELALPAAELLDRSEPTDVAGLRLPCFEDRLAHLALHAQFSDAGWQDRRLSLRTVFDVFRALKNAGHAEVIAARARFDRIGETRRFDGLLLATEILLPSMSFSADAHAWAAQSVSRIDRPTAQRWSWIRRRAEWRLRELLTNAERRRHWAARLREPGSMRRMLGKTTEALQEFR